MRRDLLAGQSIGPYRLVEPIAGGDRRGAVYRAEHPRLGARVAVKVLPHELAGQPLAIERFFRDARAVNVLRHPGIVDLLDLGTLDDGRPFLVMEYLEGATLAAMVDERGPLPIAAIAALIGEVLEALAATHAHGLVHRELSMESIFVTAEGRAKLLDFGVARLAAAGEADPRDDLAAVGAILYEGVTGTPWRGGAGAPAGDAQPAAPPPLGAVIRRALAEAVASARAMAAALAEAVGALPPGELLLPPHHPGPGARPGAGPGAGPGGAGTPGPRPLRRRAAATTGSRALAGGSGVRSPKPTGGHGTRPAPGLVAVRDGAARPTSATARTIAAVLAVIAAIIVALLALW